MRNVGCETVIASNRIPFRLFSPDLVLRVITIRLKRGSVLQAHADDPAVPVNMLVLQRVENPSCPFARISLVLRQKVARAWFQTIHFPI